MISSYHRPTRALIDLEAIANNVKSVQEHIPSDKKTFAVVKANAYGHGSVIDLPKTSGLSCLPSSK